MHKPVSIDTRMHFSKKDFHERGWDKHLTGGALASAGIALLFTPGPTPERLAIVALWTGVVTGAVVELIDYRNNKLNHETHSVELMDFLFTALGGAISASLLYILLK